MDQSISERLRSGLPELQWLGKPASDDWSHDEGSQLAFGRLGRLLLVLIANAIDRHDMASHGGNLFSERANVNIDRPVARISSGVLPDFLQDFVAGDDVSCAGGEASQDVEFGQSQIRGFSRVNRLATCGVDLERSNQNGLSRGIRGTSKARTNSGHKLLIVKGLGDVIVGAAGQPLGDVADRVFGREENDGDVPSALIFLHERASVIATEDWQHHVQKDEIWVLIPRDFHPDDGILSSQDIEVLTEHGLKKPSGFRVVFNDEQGGFFHDDFFVLSRLSGSFLGTGEKVLFSDFLIEDAPGGVSFEENLDQVGVELPT